jgi:hypothetical protein
MASASFLCRFGHSCTEYSMPQTVVVTGMSMALRNEYTERAKRVLLAQARPRDLPFLSATVGYLYLCCGFFFWHGSAWRASGCQKGAAEEPLRGCLNSKP